jgi:hypothetical protein
MRNNLLLTALIVLALQPRPTMAAPQAQDEKLFQEVKILIFDQNWSAAEALLNDLLSRSPGGAFAAQARYYKAKCIEELGGREREALRSYKSFLQLKDQNKNLVEDAEVSVVDLAFKLFNDGDKGAVKDIEDRLSHPNKIVRYYAAVQLSAVKDAKVAEKSVPVLKAVLAEEKNPELLDRAKIALLRVDPGALARLEDKPAPRGKARVLRIQVIDENTRKIEVSINIPWALADLALAAIPEREKAAMRDQGYDIQKILRDLQSTEGNIIEVRSEGKHIKIWID